MDVQEEARCLDDSFLQCLDVAKNQEDALNDDYSFLQCLDVQEDALNDDYSFLQCLEEEAKNQEEVKTQENLLCLDVLNNSFYQELIEQDKKRTYSSMSEEDEDHDGCQKKPRCNSFELSF